MDNNHFHPIAGQIYQNHNGIKYLCLESEGFSNDGLFISVSSGYVLLAHGCKQNDDGSIEWNCSEDKGFHDVHKFSVLYGFDSTGKSIVSQDDDEPSTWAEVIKIEFEGVRTELESLVYYDTKQRCFNENINPTTYDQLMESAEMNALEQYTEDERFPEWNEEAEYLFRTEYINKIKPLAEEWEAGIMYHAKLVDEHEKGSPAFGDETATEYFTDYFNTFWDRSEGKGFQYQQPFMSPEKAKKVRQFMRENGYVHYIYGIRTITGAVKDECLYFKNDSEYNDKVHEIFCDGWNNQIYAIHLR